MCAIFNRSILQIPSLLCPTKYCLYPLLIVFLIFCCFQTSYKANKPYPYSNIQPQLSRRPREEATGVPVYGILVLYSPLLLPLFYQHHHCLRGLPWNPVTQCWFSWSSSALPAWDQFFSPLLPISPASLRPLIGQNFNLCSLSHFPSLLMKSGGYVSLFT